jgi:stress response protein YsnF
MIDMMLQLQRLGLRAMTMYQPVASAFIDSALTPQSARSAGMRRRSIETHSSNEEQVIGIGEEVLNVGTRMVPGKTTRVRRVVVQTPVQQDVTLQSETVVLERRRPLSTNGSDVLTEVTVEMSDLNEVPVVSKAVRLVEEVVLRKEVTSHIETIHDTVKRDKLEIEQPSQLPVVQPSQLPVVLHPTQKQDEHKRANEAQDMNQSGGQKR